MLGPTSRTASIKALNLASPTSVCGVMRASSRPLSQALKSALDQLASNTRPVDVACAGKRAPRCKPCAKCRTGSATPALRATITHSAPSSTTALKAAWVCWASLLSVGCSVRGKREVAM